MAKVSLPPGCYGLKMEDGTVYNHKPGGSVTVEDRHAKAIGKSSNGQLGIVSAALAVSLGTRAGKRCDACAFLAQGWASECPRCGGRVTEE